MSSGYTLFNYILNGKDVVSAIHWRDVSAFLKEHPEATVRKVL